MMLKRTAQDGAQLAYHRTGAGPPVVLVHGGFIDSREWAAISWSLAADRTVWAADRRGHGQSDPYRDGYCLGDDVDDLCDWVDELAQAGEPVVVAAHSAGCLVALAAASRGAPIGGLLLYEAPMPDGPRVDRQVWDRLDDAALAQDRALLVEIVLADVVGRLTGEVLPPPAFAVMLTSPLGQLFMANALSIPTELRAYESIVWSDKDLRGITIPTVLQVGGDSPPYHRRFSDRMHALAPNTELNVLPGGNHGTPINDPQAVAAAIRRLGEPP